MTNKTYFHVWKRFFVVSTTLILVLGVIDLVLYRARREEAKTQMVLEVLQKHKLLTNELHTVFHAVESDSNFFSKNINRLLKLSPQSLEYRTDVKALLEFLETHPGYFKVRVITRDGQELFKLVQNREHTGFLPSTDLFNLSAQDYFKEILNFTGTTYYFSSMRPNIINGVVEEPVRPTIRVSKRIELNHHTSGLLVLNIDGERILKLFSDDINIHSETSEMALLDRDGFYVASNPRKDIQEYTINKTLYKQPIPNLFMRIKAEKNIQGSFSSADDLLVYSKLQLPNTNESWFLISKTPNDVWEKLIHNELLTWIFWEIVFLSFFLTWLWKDDKKRHQDEVVGVLLKERSEFIQNVSHQLKTPLAIMLNSLEVSKPSEEHWGEFKKEIIHLKKVVEDMLLLAQVDSFQNLPLKNGNILEIVSSAVDVTGTKAKLKGVSIRFNLDEKSFPDHVNLEMPMMSDLLQSAIVNLIDNAIDFSSQGCTVDVWVTKQGSKVVLRISDSGPGVPDDFIPHMFQRFSRRDVHGRKGTGLGLAISKKIVELHRGDLKYIKGTQGAIFEIKLPFI